MDAWVGGVGVGGITRCSRSGRAPLLDLPPAGVGGERPPWRPWPSSRCGRVASGRSRPISRHNQRTPTATAVGALSCWPCCQPKPSLAADTGLGRGRLRRRPVPSTALPTVALAPQVSCRCRPPPRQAAGSLPISLVGEAVVAGLRAW